MCIRRETREKAAVGGIFLKPRGLRSPTREVLKDTEN